MLDDPVGGGEPRPSLGNQTAEDLVKQGRAGTVKAYLARIAAGGYGLNPTARDRL